MGCLNTPHNRTSVLGLLRRKKVDKLSETHHLKADIRRLTDKFYHVTASSSASTKVLGVAIVAKSCLNIKVLDVWADSSWRKTIAKIECSNRKIALMSVYAPNQFDADFYSVLTDIMLQLADYIFIAGSNFKGPIS